MHASLLVALVGHGPGAAGLRSNALEISIEAVAMPDLPAPPLPLPTPQNASTPVPHVHSYAVPLTHDARPHDPSIVHATAPAHHDEPTSPAASSTEVVVAAAPLRCSMTLGSAATAHIGVTSADGGGHLIEGPPLAEGAVGQTAKLLQGVTLPYPPQARAEEIEADVILDIVVDLGGNVTDARVARHAGYGFDEAALKAIRSFRFRPAQRGGRPVAVRMKWTVDFRLR